MTIADLILKNRFKTLNNYVTDSLHLLPSDLLYCSQVRCSIDPLRHVEQGNVIRLPFTFGHKEFTLYCNPSCYVMVTFMFSAGFVVKILTTPAPPFQTHCL